MIDYRELLKAYMRHVEAEEGVTFVNDFPGYITDQLLSEYGPDLEKFKNELSKIELEIEK